MFEMWDFFREMGGLKCGMFFGGERCFLVERKAPQAGASATPGTWRHGDWEMRKYGEGEAVFQDCFSDYLGNYFSDYA